MRIFLAIFILFCVSAKAQDKLFMKNGTVKKAIIVSIARDVVYFKNTDTSAVEKIDKSDLIMTENYKGIRHIFGSEEREQPGKKNSAITYRKNSFGMQPFALLTGRATFVFERYVLEDKIGIAIPLSITFDPLGSLYGSGVDTNKNAPKRIPGINFITGADVNFYFGNDEDYRFFIGPRFRYGTDLFLRGLEAYTFQTQAGWKLGRVNGLVSQHISLGFGFARVLSTSGGPLLQAKRSYGWYSINYRVSINW